MIIEKGPAVDAREFRKLYGRALQDWATILPSDTEEFGRHKAIRDLVSKLMNDANVDDDTYDAVLSALGVGMRSLDGERGWVNTRDPHDDGTIIRDFDNAELRAYFMTENNGWFYDIVIRHRDEYDEDQVLVAEVGPFNTRTKALVEARKAYVTIYRKGARR
jgi:hypothetical protein